MRRDERWALIAAVVNLGYSENVMEAARGAGAGGGTVIPGQSWKPAARRPFSSGA